MLTQRTHVQIITAYTVTHYISIFIRTFVRLFCNGGFNIFCKNTGCSKSLEHILSVFILHKLF